MMFDGWKYQRGERPFDAVPSSVPGEKYLDCRATLENKVGTPRGEVGKDRFLILCALKDGRKSLRDILSHFIEFKMRDNYPVDDLQAMLLLGRPTEGLEEKRHLEAECGEGWLERNRQANFSPGIESAVAN